MPIIQFIRFGSKVWTFSLNTTGALHSTEGKMNGLRYQGTLDKVINLIDLESDGRFNKTDDPKHSAKIIPKGLAWSSQSFDLNFTGKLRKILKLGVHH